MKGKEKVMKGGGRKLVFPSCHPLLTAHNYGNEPKREIKMINDMLNLVEAEASEPRNNVADIAAALRAFCPPEEAKEAFGAWVDWCNQADSALKNTKWMFFPCEALALLWSCRRLRVRGMCTVHGSVIPTNIESRLSALVTAFADRRGWSTDDVQKVISEGRCHSKESYYGLTDADAFFRGVGGAQQAWDLYYHIHDRFEDKCEYGDYAISGTVTTHWAARLRLARLIVEESTDKSLASDMMPFMLSWFSGVRK